jgi:hypothetical protein
MKYVYSLLLLLTTITSVQIMGMNPHLTPPQIEMCEKIKNLNVSDTHNVPTEEYKNTARELIKHDLSIEICVQRRVEEERNKARAKLEKEFKIAPNWEEHDVRVQKKCSEQAQHAHVTFDPSVPQKDVEFINKIIEKNNIKLPLRVEKKDSKANPEIGLMEDGKTFILTLTKQYDRHSTEAQEGLLLHEFTHGTRGHDYYMDEIREELKKQALAYQNARIEAERGDTRTPFRTLFWIRNQHSAEILAKAREEEERYYAKIAKLQENPAYLAHARSLEFEADMGPTAQGTLENARAMACKTREVVTITPLSEVNKQSKHPAPLQMMYDVKRIVLLKEAAEDVRNKTAQTNTPKPKGDAYFSQFNNQFE